jgi:serine/threonine protein phosphatase PrpC
VRLISWAQSDTGRKRANNEDNFLCSESLGLFAVADGMGGHKGGARASSLALEVLEESVGTALESESSSTEGGEQAVEQGGRQSFATGAMQSAAQAASGEVHRQANMDPSLEGMGTTLTAMLYKSGWMQLVHAGDSRAYLFRDGRIRQLTDDHSWTAEQIRNGLMTEAEAADSQFKHVITRSIGYDASVEVDTPAVIIQTGDCFLLCSDGLSNYISEAELREIMSNCWYRRLPQTLIDLANERGGDDNITVVVVYAANHLENEH